MGDGAAVEAAARTVWADSVRDCAAEERQKQELVIDYIYICIIFEQKNIIEFLKTMTGLS